MSLVPSLLQAIVHVDGEALVMHAGDKPYVVSPTGQVDLASRGLALDAVNGIVNQLLPLELQRALDEFGAVQYELPAVSEFPGECFTIVAARGADDLWVEIRRRRIPEEDQIPEEFFPPREVAAAAQPYPVYASAGSPKLGAPVEPPPDAFDVQSPAVAEMLGDRPAPPASFQPPVIAAVPDVQPAAEEVVVPIAIPEPVPQSIDAFPSEEIVLQPASDIASPCAPSRPHEHEAIANAPEPQPVAVIAAPELIAAKRAVAAAEKEPEPPVAPEPVSIPAPAAAAEPVAIRTPLVVQEQADREPERDVPLVVAADAAKAPTTAPVAAAAAPEPTSVPPLTPIAVAPGQPAVVLPLARNPIRAEQPQTPLVEDPTMSGLDRLLRLAAARGASTLYLSSSSRPSVRVDGELQILEGEPLLAARDVESLLLTLMPERNHEALRTGAATEWICDIEEVGRVRCMSFRDHRGPGGVFRLMPTRSVSADHLGLPKAIQSLAIEPEGLVLVAGPRSSGKRTLMSAFVDLINRTRRDHVITIEREINIVHERGTSFISQREVRGSDAELAAAARAALREDPDVLMIEDLRTADLMNVALEAASSGHLVVGGLAAHSATGAIDRIIDLYPPEGRLRVQLSLADSLRGVIVQVLLRKKGGGRIAAREVLLNTPAVSSVIGEGKTSQLPLTIEGGRRYGMMPLNDALVALVEQATVDPRDAYRYASDRSGLVAALERHGLDTSFVERLA